MDETSLRAQMNEEANGIEGLSALPESSMKAARKKLRRNRLIAGLVGVASVSVTLITLTQVNALGPKDDTAVTSSSPGCTAPGENPCVDEPAEQMGPSRGGVGDQVWDGSVAFSLFRLDCGGTSIGDQDSQLHASGRFCTAYFDVLNGSDSEVTLPRDRHLLKAGEETIRLWSQGMEEMELDNPGSPYVHPIPPGGGATAGVLFELSPKLEPAELLLYAGDDSVGAVIDLSDCGWSRFKGKVLGGCYRSDVKEPEIGMRYPHAISTYAGPGVELLQVSCFGQVEWEVTSVPRSPVPEGFLGQGTIVLSSKTEATFHDNSGITLELRATATNGTDPGICG